jgi:hypothetical protein
MRKIRLDIATHKAGERRIFTAHWAVGKDQNDLRRRSRSGFEGEPSTALF